MSKQAENKNTQGGKRPGAGPKPHGDEPKKMVSMRLDTDLMAYLRSERERTGVSVAQQVEQAIRLLRDSQRQ